MSGAVDYDLYAEYRVWNCSIVYFKDLSLGETFFSALASHVFVKISEGEAQSFTTGRVIFFDHLDAVEVDRGLHDRPVQLPQSILDLMTLHEAIMSDIARAKGEESSVIPIYNIEQIVRDWVDTERTRLDVWVNDAHDPTSTAAPHVFFARKAEADKWRERLNSLIQTITDAKNKFNAWFEQAAHGAPNEEPNESTELPQAGNGNSNTDTTGGPGI